MSKELTKNPNKYLVRILRRERGLVTDGTLITMERHPIEGTFGLLHLSVS